MRQKTMSKSDPAEQAIRDIRRKTRKRYSAEEKIRIVLSGLRGEESIAALCRHEGIAEGLYYSWSKEFLEAGKKRLAGDTARQASSPEVKTLRVEARDLKEALAEWLEGQGMEHVRGAPYHPQTQGKIERWHQTLKNRILLENYYLQSDLENQIGTFVDYYNNHRYHESIGNVTPSDAYFGRHTAIIEKREKIKKLTIQTRRLNHQQQAA
jgi:transposase-like protein